MFRLVPTLSVWVAAVFLSLTVQCGTAQSSNAGASFTGLQSGKDDTASSYAGGMVYSNGMLYITGATYGTNFFKQVAVDAILHSSQGGLPTKFPHFCFVASIQAASSSSITNTNLAWGERQQFVIDAQHSQACTTLTAASKTTATTATPDLLISGYHAEAHLNAGMDVAGIIYDSTLSATLPKPSDFAVTTGEVIEPAVYPVAVVSVANATATALFIASMYSNSTSWKNGSYTPQDGDTVDPTTSLMGAFTNYSMNVQKLVRSSIINSNNPNAAWTTVWRQSYATHDGSSVHMTSSMLFLPRKLNGQEVGALIIVGGYTAGFGLAFGANAESTGDMDGFVTKLYAETGLLPLKDTHNIANMSSTESQFGPTFSKRIQSQTNINDFVMGLCHAPSTSDASISTPSTVLYAVGTTEGIMAGTAAGGAFLIQLDVDTLQPIWTQQISGLNVEGIDCAVTPDGQHVYLGGNHPYGTTLNVANGRRRRRRLEEIAPPSSSTDMFVAQFIAFNGSLTWIQTIGTPGGNERMAQGNGLAVDEQGNVYVYGNTRGSLFRDNAQATNDVFVTFLTRDNNVGSSSSSPATPSATSGSTNYTFQKVNVAVLFIVATLVTILLAGLYLICRRRQRRRKDKQQSRPLTGELQPYIMTVADHDLQLAPAVFHVDNSLDDNNNHDNESQHSVTNGHHGAPPPSSLVHVPSLV